MQINNPFIKQAQNSAGETVDARVIETTAASRKGIGLKTLFLLIAAIASGVIVAVMFNKVLYGEPMTDAQMNSYLTKLYTTLVIAAVTSSIGFLIGRFIPSAAVVGGPIYAVGEGALLGALCALCEVYLNGITAIAGIGTAVMALVTYAAYAFGLRKHMGKVASFFIIYAISLLIAIIALNIYLALNNVSESSAFTINIVICIAYLAYGVLMLLLNFEEAESAVQRGVDKKYEWSIALGLVYTILMIFYYLIYLILTIASKTRKD